MRVDGERRRRPAARRAPRRRAPGSSEPGIGLPCGHVVGSPSTRTMAASTSSEITCSHLPASLWATAHERPSMSVRNRSASRCRRTTRSASFRPAAVRSMRVAVEGDEALDLHALDHLRHGRPGHPRRSAMRAWMTSTSSSRSSKIVSQYSSKAGCHSGDWYSATAPSTTGGPNLGQPASARHGPGRTGRESWRCPLFSAPVRTWFETTFGDAHRRPRPRAGRPSPPASTP